MEKNFDNKHPVDEPVDQFEIRKRQHIEESLKDKNEAIGQAGFEKIKLVHEALPEIDFSEVSIQQNVFSKKCKTPFLVSSMTAGHVGSINLNVRLAQACEKQGWLMGVGSQRKELFDDSASDEWLYVREKAPNVKLLSNIGLSQLIHAPLQKIKALLNKLSAEALLVHTNPVQECLQPEGTPNFKGGIAALKAIASELNVPVILKETGCGFSIQSLEAIKNTGIYAVDLAGFGGTHWGRIEGSRALTGSVHQSAAESFSNWGISTVDSLMNAQQVVPDYNIWASGGLRSGLDAAKALALGAEVAGFAKPLLQAALNSDELLLQKMQTYEYELKMALFCTGSKNITELSKKIKVDR